MTGVLLVETLALIAFVAAIVVTIVLRKAQADRGERRDAVLREHVRPAVFAFVASDGEDVRPLELAFATQQRQRKAIRRVTVELLLEYAGDLRGEVLERIREVLRAQGLREEALADLRSRRAWRRALGAHELGLLADPSTIPALTVAIRDRDVPVRIAAARAMGRIGDPAAVGALLSSRDGDRPTPYGVVSHALARIGPSGRDDLLAGLVHPSFRVRRMALDVCGELRITAARAAASSILVNDRDTLVRIRAARALGRIGTADVLGELYDSARGDNADIRQSIVRAVADIGAQASLPVLRRALGDDDHATARAAAEGLLELGRSGHAILRAVAAGPGSAAIYALEALDTLAPVTDAQRERVRAWRPATDREVAFPTTRVTAR